MKPRDPSSRYDLAIAIVMLGAAACQGLPADEVEQIQLHQSALVAADIEANLAFAEQQALKSENRLATAAHPRATPTDFAGGQWQTVSRTDWRSGFFTGLEWMLYETYGANANGWLAKADARTRDFANEVNRAQTHDVGFKTITSYGQGFRLTNLEEFRPKIFQGANTLAARFSTQYGVTRSWDNTGADFRVIIDNMMNLEVLFLAAELTSSAADRDRWLNIAVSHARKTEQNQVRDSANPDIDGSTCHVYFYNLGVCRTHQGLSDSSTWTRGQAWAIYGFTMAYQYARRYPQYAADADLFLATAQRTANLYLRRRAEPKHGDWVPLHDFDAGASNPKDSSAAAVVSSALLELSRIPAVPADRRAEYRAAAESTLDALRSTAGSKPYRTAATAAETGKETILLRATTTYRGAGNTANADVERGLIYADYYFVEALLRHKDMYGAAPRAPAFLAASAAPGGIALGWKSTRGAAAYTVKRGDSGAGPFTTLGTAADPVFLDATAVPGASYHYVVTATNQVGVESGNSNVAPGSLPAPGGWTSGDVGSASPAGSTSDSGGVLTVRGAGADVWGTADAFHFHRRQVTGNVTIVARVTAIQNTHGFAKAGVMIREGLTAGARNVYAHITPTATNGFRLQWRPTAGVTTERVNVGTTATPTWLRLVRTGNDFAASSSPDGTNWTTIGTATVTMGATVEVGLAVTSHANGTLNTSTFDSVTVTP